MKNFKTPLLIEGNPGQLDALIPQLEKLGYVSIKMGDILSANKLITFFNGISNQITDASDSFVSYAKVANTNKRRLIVSASNPELVLALAAMVDDDELYGGEYCKCYNIASRQDVFTTGKLYKAHKDGWENLLQFIDNEGHYNGYSGSNKKYFKKATVEEIINFFNMKTEDNQACSTASNDGAEERKIIGYKVKKGVDKKAASLLVGLMVDPPIKINDNPDVVFQIDSCAYNTAIKLGILEQLFEPAYEEPVFKVGDYIYTSPGSNGHGLHLDDINKVFKVREISRGNYLSLDTIPGQNKYTHGVRAQDVRKATPEEIAAAQTKIITLRCEGGTFEIEVSKKGIRYITENKFLRPDDLRGVLLNDTRVRWKTGVYGTRSNDQFYLFSPSAINSGCKKNVPIEDWVKVMDAFDELKNDQA